MNNPQLAVGYVRVSTEDQRLGPEAQKAEIQEWAVRNGVLIVAWHVDQGVSGAAPLEERPGLLAAIASVRALKAGILIAAKRDRVARDVVVAGLISRAVAKEGAELRTLDATSSGPEGALMSTILDAMAEFERARIKTRTKAALDVKRARGEKLGGRAPYGYGVGTDGKTLVEDAGEQAIISKVRNLRGNGVSLRGIVTQLDSDGHVGRTGRPLALTQIANILAA